MCSFVGAGVFLTCCINKEHVEHLLEGLFTAAHKQGAVVQYRQLVIAVKAIIKTTAEADEAEVEGWINMDECVSVQVKIVYTCKHPLNCAGELERL